MEKTELSVCGVHCPTDCHAYGAECEGCVALAGKVAWAEFLGVEHCPIYSCVRDKGLASCGDCGLAPCQVWLDTKNPAASPEEFAADIASRLKNLRHARLG